MAKKMYVECSRNMRKNNLLLNISFYYGICIVIQQSSCHNRQTFILASCLFHLSRNSRKLGLSQIVKATCTTLSELKEKT